MKFHPLAELFPKMTATEQDDLLESIRANGLIRPITVYQDSILDGRHRFEACVKLGIEPKTHEYKGTNPTEFVIISNLKRRHLNASQRAVIAAKLANLGQGGDRSKVPIGTLKIDDAAKKLNVSKRTVKRANKVLKEAPDKVAAINNGTKTVAAAVKEIKEAESLREVPLDRTGYPVPDKAREYWHRSDEAKEILRFIQKARSAVRDIDTERERNPGDMLYVEVNTNAVIAALTRAHEEFNCAIPYAVCGFCQGVTPETCTVCKGRGLLSKFKWNTCVPQEMKDLREKVAHGITNNNHQ